jgi:hypothetical protein
MVKNNKNKKVTLQLRKRHPIWDKVELKTVTARCNSILLHQMSRLPMRNVFFRITLLLALCTTTPVFAQKAYDVIRYKAMISGHTATLELADGYLLASKVIIRSANGNLVFTSMADAADEKGNLRLDQVSGSGRINNFAQSWLVLEGLNGHGYPPVIKATSWNGKMQRTVVFKAEK